MPSVIVIAGSAASSAGSFVLEPGECCCDSPTACFYKGTICQSPICPAPGVAYFPCDTLCNGEPIQHGQVVHTSFGNCYTISTQTKYTPCTGPTPPPGFECLPPGAPILFATGCASGCGDPQCVPFSGWMGLKWCPCSGQVGVPNALVTCASYYQCVAQGVSCVIALVGGKCAYVDPTQVYTSVPPGYAVVPTVCGLNGCCACCATDVGTGCTYGNLAGNSSLKTWGPLCPPQPTITDLGNLKICCTGQANQRKAKWKVEYLQWFRWADGTECLTQRQVWEGQYPGTRLATSEQWQAIPGECPFAFGSSDGGVSPPPACDARAMYPTSDPLAPPLAFSTPSPDQGGFGYIYATPLRYEASFGQCPLPAGQMSVRWTYTALIVLDPNPGVCGHGCTPKNQTPVPTGPAGPLSPTIISGCAGCGGDGGERGVPL